MHGATSDSPEASGSYRWPPTACFDLPLVGCQKINFAKQRAPRPAVVSTRGLRTSRGGSYAATAVVMGRSE